MQCTDTLSEVVLVLPSQKDIHCVCRVDRKQYVMWFAVNLNLDFTPKPQNPTPTPPSAFKLKYYIYRPALCVPFDLVLSRFN